MADPVGSATGEVRGAGSGLTDAVLRHAFVHNADPVAMARCFFWRLQLGGAGRASNLALLIIY